MAVNSVHPLYGQQLNNWKLLRTSYKGAAAIKDQGTVYLPPTTSMEQAGMEPNAQGFKEYRKYIQRAVYPGLVRTATEILIGSLWAKPPVIEVPTALDPILEAITLKGESAEQLMMRIHEAQLTTGRIGLLLDIAEDAEGNPRPYIATYEAEAILNWDEGKRDDPNARSFLNLVVLDESEYERNAIFEWDWQEKYRVLILGDPDANEDQGSPAIYQVAALRTTSFDSTALIVPTIRGQSLNEIPFVFINPKDTNSDTDEPPLLPLADAALTIYRGEADYRQHLYLQGQDTLVIVGTTTSTLPDGTPDIRIGAGALLQLTQGSDAKYVGVASDGLPEQRTALENDYNRAAALSGQLLDAVSREKESGDALSIRINAKTASLRQISITAAAGMERILKICAQWMGANPDDVVVTPNLDFADISLTSKTLVELVSAKNMGAPISLETIHLIMQDRGMTELSFEEEMAKIEEEAALGIGRTEDVDPQEEEQDAEAGTDDEQQPDTEDPSDQQMP